MEVRESGVVVAFSFLVALLTDDEGCEGAVHRVTGHLTQRKVRERYGSKDTVHCPHMREISGNPNTCRLGDVETLHHPLL